MSSAISRLARGFCTKIEIATPPPTLKARIASLYQENDLTKFVEQFKELSENRGFRGQHNIYKKTIARLASAQKFSLIEDLLGHHTKYQDIKKESFAVRLILLYGKAGMADHAHKLFDELPQRQCERTVKSLSALLHAYVLSNKFDESQKLLRELPLSTSIKPNDRCYNLVIEALCAKRDFDSAEKMLDEMESNGLKSDVSTFNMLTKGFYYNGRFQDGDRVWDRMENSGVQPNVSSFNAKFKGLLHAGKITEAVNLLDELKTRDLNSYVSTYNILVRWYCIAGNLDEAKAVYDRLKEGDCIPNEGTYQALIACSCDKEDLDHALELCKESVNSKYGFSLIDVDVLQTLVNLLVKNSRVEEAEEILKLAYSIHYNPSKLKMPTTIHYDRLK